VLSLKLNFEIEHRDK